MVRAEDLPQGQVAWLTWERQRRNEGVARALDVPLFELVFRGGRLQRYLRASGATAKILFKVQPRVLFVQNPSLVLALAAVFWGRITGRPVVVDAHNAGLVPFNGESRVLCGLAALVTRLASITIVSNDSLLPQVNAYGGRPFVLPDPIPELPAGVTPKHELKGSKRVLFICSYASDEPYYEVIDAARHLDPATVIYITGNPKDLGPKLREIAPPNVVFTGFLPEPEFIGLLHASDVVMDLTTRPDCLVCGAYEGVAAGKPLVLSDSGPTREYFSGGAVYTDNGTASIAACVRKALEDQARLAGEIVELRRKLVQDWAERRQALRTLLNDLAQKRPD